MQIILRFQSILQLHNNINRFKSILFFSICLSFSFTQAYTLFGIILDSETKDPLSNVNIYIKNSDLGGPIYNIKRFVMQELGSFTLGVNLL